MHGGGVMVEVEIDSSKTHEVKETCSNMVVVKSKVLSFDNGIFYNVAEIGIGLIGFGIFFTFLGIILFFDRGLLALGNIFSLAGVAIILGWRSTLSLFTNTANYKGSASFLLGLFFIFVRWPILGIILEIYGCIFLFRDFWSSIKMFLYHIPVVGWVIQFISPAESDSGVNKVFTPDYQFPVRATPWLLDCNRRGYG
ncbi:hypothetical protein VNO78_14645 [Psophocarpus tetragonolobus]|uniref:Vesicle transport protein GOT1 n=1 Tax=Psophocarpus tetragonolobus TaxID=3891 RepID=A0AAN9SD89_PSOTE